MSKKRVGIYIEEEVWKRVKELAWKEHKSVSEYIEGRLGGSNAKKLVEDVIIPPKTYRDTDYVDRTTRGDMLGPRSDDEVIREVQDKLENIQASRGYFNPQPKGGK